MSNDEKTLLRDGATKAVELIQGPMTDVMRRLDRLESMVSAMATIVASSLATAQHEDAVWSVLEEGCAGIERDREQRR